MARVLVPIRSAFLAFLAAQQFGPSLTVYVIAAFTLTTVVFGPVGLVTVSSLIVLLVTGAMGAIAAYDVERSYCKDFLEGAFIAELVAQDGVTGL